MPWRGLKRLAVWDKIKSCELSCQLGPVPLPGMYVLGFSELCCCTKSSLFRFRSGDELLEEDGRGGE